MIPRASKWTACVWGQQIDWIKNGISGNYIHHNGKKTIRVAQISIWGQPQMLQQKYVTHIFNFYGMKINVVFIMTHSAVSGVDFIWLRKLLFECFKTELFNSMGALDNCQAYKCQIHYLYFTGNKFEEPFILSHLKRILLCLDMLTWVPFEMHPGRQTYLLKQQNIFFMDWHERKVKAFSLETEQMSSDERFSGGL